MRITTFAALASLAVSGCAADPNLTSTAPCPSVMDTSSYLADQVSRLKHAPVCHTYTHDQNRHGSSYLAAGDLGFEKPGDDTGNYLAVSVWRVDDRVPEWLPLDLSKFAGANAKGTPVPGYIKTTLGTRPVNAEAFKLDMEDLKYPSSCLAADTTGDNHVKTRVIVCRGISLAADESEVLRIAKQIAEDDFPAMQP